MRTLVQTVITIIVHRSCSTGLWLAEDELRAGSLRVVDLTSLLGPDTPVIDLPPIFAPSPGVTISEISRYDERGPPGTGIF